MALISVTDMPLTPPASVGGNLDDIHSAISIDLYRAQQRYRRLKMVIGRICKAVQDPSVFGRQMTIAHTRDSGQDAPPSKA